MYFIVSFSLLNRKFYIVSSLYKFMLDDRLLKIGRQEKQVLDLLLHHEPKIVALRLNFMTKDGKVDIQRVYNIKSYFQLKVQNAEDFLAVARSQYGGLLKKRRKGPKIMPTEMEAEEEEK